MSKVELPKTWMSLRSTDIGWNCRAKSIVPRYDCAFETLFRCRHPICRPETDSGDRAFCVTDDDRIYILPRQQMAIFGGGGGLIHSRRKHLLARELNYCIRFFEDLTQSHCLYAPKSTEIEKHFLIRFYHRQPQTTSTKLIFDSQVSGRLRFCRITISQQSILHCSRCFVFVGGPREFLSSCDRFSVRSAFGPAKSLHQFDFRTVGARRMRWEAVLIGPIFGVFLDRTAEKSAALARANGGRAYLSVSHSPCYRVHRQAYRRMDSIECRTHITRLCILQSPL